MKDEILDYVDENQNIIGKVERSKIDELGLIGQISGVVLFNKKNEVLLSKNSEYKGRNKGKWHFSAIGHVKSGETRKETAKIEAFEEIGAKINSVEEIFVIDNSNLETYIGKGRRFIYIFKANYDGDFVLDENEVEEVKWFKIDEINQKIKNDISFFTEDFIKFWQKSML